MQTHRLYLEGKVKESRRLRSQLRARLRSAISSQPQNVALWCLLGDHYWRKDRAARCFLEALRVDPRHPEANAELAYLLALKGDKRAFRRHFDRALAYCKGFDVEDSVIHKALDAAKIIGDSKREALARRMGLRRFPEESCLFR